ncbi:5-oxoprolinase subunit B family protein [Vibrio cincinnatiensis]
MDSAVNYTLQPISETSLLVTFESPSHPNLSIYIGQIAAYIQAELGEFVMNITPAYTTILIDYLPYRIAPQDFEQRLRYGLAHSGDLSPVQVKNIALPVYYHSEVGPDLALYQQQGFSLTEVITLHTQHVYTVSAIGFAPGFAFMTDVHPKLQRPRRETPRLFVPQGSVAIAEQQTAVYPNHSPGGWNIIGNCPIALFNPTQDPMLPWTIGSKVSFYSIDRKEFLALGGVIHPQVFQRDDNE